MRTHNFTSLTLLMASASAALFARSARAQDQYDEMGVRKDTAPLYTDYGVGITVGGGVEDFTNTTARDTTELAGSWNLRLELGAALPISVEAAYVGTDQKIDGLTGTQNANLLGTTVEGALKFNVPTGTSLRPFAFAGLGWRRYDVTNEKFTTSSEGIADKDDLMVFPLGAGLRYDYRGVDADLRFTFRPTIGEDLITDPSRDNGFAAMHTWGVGASIGANL